MQDDTWGISSFYGGQSVDAQLGTKAQYWYGRCIDSRKNPTQFTVLPGTAKTGGAVVTDLVLDLVKTDSGIIYAVGDSGNVYRVKTDGTWSLVFKMNEASGAGLVYRSDLDIVYITGQTSVARIKNAKTNSPSYDQNFFKNGRSTSSTCYKTGGTNTFTLPTTIQETIANLRAFTSDIAPFYSIKVLVTAKGTGDWTLTLHDDANTTLATKTITNANLVNGQLNEFVLSAPFDGLVSPNARTYHYHLTSTVADGTIATTTASSMTDCDMELWANALETTTSTLHPAIQFANMTLFGNGRYVTSYEPLQDQPTTADYTRHRLTFPPGYEAIGFAQLDLYCAIAAAKYDSNGKFIEGKIFLWDGIQTTYNRYWDVPEGAPESLFAEKNILAYIAGGALYRSSGTQPVKVRTFRNTDSEFTNISDTTKAPPHGMTVRRGILLIAYPFSTTNQTLEHGVYALGHISNQYPESWTYNYIPSTGSILNNGSNNLRIGTVKNFGDTLYMSWRDDSASPQKYGVDIVNNSSSPAGYFTFENLTWFPNPYKPKAVKKLVATFTPMPVGVRFRFKYKIDGATNWSYSDWFSTISTDATGYDPGNVGDTHYLFDLAALRFSYINIGIEGNVVGATTPAFTYVGLTTDLLKNEREFDQIG